MAETSVSHRRGSIPDYVLERRLNYQAIEPRTLVDEVLKPITVELLRVLGTGRSLAGRTNGRERLIRCHLPGRANTRSHTPRPAV